VPYIAHLISVSAMVWEDGGNEDQAIAALLHDSIEDQGLSHDAIAERFGETVAAIVRDCTDTTGAVSAGGNSNATCSKKSNEDHYPTHSCSRSSNACGGAEAL
jgi:(p)ppGpp synthase/HD superfamily hydrolase